MRWYGRLRSSREVAYVRRRGRPVALPILAAYALPAPDGRARVCVSVSKAVGGAVVRNRVRRRIQGALDALPAHARVPLRVLFVARPSAAAQPYGPLAAEVGAALGRLAAVS